MQRCIQLAEMGLGNVAPNPLAGCIILHDSKIIGEGYHKEFGGSHAEVNAINSVRDKELLKKSTLYCNLEPCAHQGKTPPCADLIIKHKIPQVIIGNVDPFTKVNGMGIKKLQQAGIQTQWRISEEECRFSNRRFMTFWNKKRPYIILKWTQSADGYIGYSGKKTMLSNEISKMLVHKWRTEEASVMAGSITVKTDNPQLNSRYWQGKNPTRIIIDKNLMMQEDLHVFDQAIPTLVFNFKKNKTLPNLEYLKLEDKDLLNESMLDRLHELNIQSVLIEGGSILLQSFIEKGLWDEARVFTVDKILQQGIKAPHVAGWIFSIDHFLNDTLTVYFPS